MSQQKRKLEEYQDPDYLQFTEVKKKKLAPILDSEKIEKIQTIIKKEFEKELTGKELEINKIEARLLQAKQLLHRVRYAIVSNFYRKKGLELVEDEQAKQSNEQSNSMIDDIHNLPSTSNSSIHTVPQPQKAIHPSLRKLLGKQPVDYDEILRICPVRQAAKTAKSSLSERIRKKKDEKQRKQKLREIAEHRVIDESLNVKDVTINEERLKVPRYIEPIKIEKNIPQVNSSRGRNQTRHLIVVGKY